MNTNKLIQRLNFYEKNNYLQGNLVVSLNNQTIINKSYGHSVIEHQIANDETTRFKVGSLTKAFTSLIIMKLYEQSKLNIYESVSNYLKEFEKIPDITIYHCMTNTSGLTDFCGKEDYWPLKMRTSMTLEAIICEMLKEGVAFKPGTNFSYSSTGYLVLTRIIEKILGKSYSEALQTYILHPLKMANSGCMDEFTLVPKLANSYGFWEKEIRAIETNMSFPTGAFGMYSTINDLLKWGRALCEEKLLFPKSFKTYLSPALETYACGWDCTKISGVDFIQHQGDVDGFVSSIKIARREQLVIIFLSNLEVTAVTQLTRELAACLLDGTTDIPREKQVDVSRKERKKICGKYFYIESSTGKKQILSISINDFGELFLIVEKRFAIFYKFHLTSFKNQEDKRIFRCDKIDETIEWTTDGRLIYIDLNKKRFELTSEK